MVLSIKNPGFGNLSFAILSNGFIHNIFKKIIFVNLINNAIIITKYLSSKLFQQIKTTKSPNQII